MSTQEREENVNVIGGDLAGCCSSPMTGFYRSGYCETGAQDLGLHCVCAEMTEEFLEFSKEVGNDLSTPRREFNFPGLKPGDRWCVCAARWQEACDAGKAPPVILSATHKKALEVVQLEDLKTHAIDLA